MLDNIQLVVTVVVCFASLSHFYSSKPSGQGVARSLWPKHPLQAVLPHSCHGRKAADVDLWGLGRRSWPQNQSQEIVCADAFLLLRDVWDKVSGKINPFAIWLCPGWTVFYNDLHYFDIQDVFLFSWVVF